MMVFGIGNVIHAGFWHWKCAAMMVFGIGNVLKRTEKYSDQKSLNFEYLECCPSTVGQQADIWSGKIFSGFVWN